MVAPPDLWLDTIWPRVRAHLPPAPARVVDLGCGPLGGFVPYLRSEGYDAVGVDPKAPDAPGYLRTEFEHAEVPRGVDAVVACASLHHVADPAHVLERMSDVLVTGGAVVVVEWAWEEFDAQTAEWAFGRLRVSSDPGWLNRRFDEWRTSGEDWPSYLESWAEAHGLHPAGKLVPLLDAQLRRRSLARGPFLFADLADTSEADEQAAIDAGHVRPLRIDYVGVRG
jgi:SAM-dependent methyltransferase